MASPAHQWLLVWAGRLMAKHGFVLGGFEAPAPHGGIWNALPAPFQIGGHRPDAWGLQAPSGTIAVAEAKTFDDVDTRHTRDQLMVFGFLRMRSSKDRCPLYIAIPRSAVYELDRVLIDVGLISAPHVIRVHVPDALISA